MSVDFLSGFSELENKIEVLLQSLEELRDENAILKQSSDLTGAKASELESKVSELETEKQNLENENQGLKSQVEELTAQCDDERSKVSAAAERVQNLLSKFE